MASMMGGGSMNQSFDFGTWYLQQMMLQNLFNPVDQLNAANARLPAHLQFSDSTGDQEASRARANFRTYTANPQVESARVEALNATPFGGGNSFAAQRLASLESDLASREALVGEEARTGARDALSRERAAYMGTPYFDPTGAAQSGINTGALNYDEPSFMDRFKSPSTIGNLAQGGYNVLSNYFPQIGQSVRQNGLIGAAAQGVAKAPGAIKNLLLGQGF